MQGAQLSCRSWVLGSPELQLQILDVKQADTSDTKPVLINNNWQGSETALKKMLPYPKANAEINSTLTAANFSTRKKKNNPIPRGDVCLGGVCTGEAHTA